MTRRPLLSSLFLLLFALSACDTGDEPCAGGSCERDGRDQAGDPITPAPSTLLCQRACETLTGTCGDEVRGDTTAIRAVAACIDWCAEGGLTANEALCLASTECTSGIGCLAE